MGGTAEATTLMCVVGVGARARRIKERREALGMDIGDLASEAQVDRRQLGQVEAGKHEPKEAWWRRVENALDRIEHETGMDEPGTAGPERPRVIRFTVEGVYGAKAIIVEAEPEDRAALEAAVDRIMRNLRSGTEGDSPEGA